MKNISLTDRVLLFFEENRLLIAKTIQRPSSLAYNYLNTRDQISRQSYYNVIGKLKKNGYLVEVEENGKKRLKTTLRGKFKIIKFIKKKRIWDGKWRIVVFDIPEIHKKTREFFREKLFDLGFRKLQESVWICPYDIANDIEDLISLCHADNYVHYLLVEELDNKNVLMELFNLTDE